LLDLIFNLTYFTIKGDIMELYERFLVFLLGLILGVLLLMGLEVLFERTYKDGQIAVLTGKTSIMLVVQPDSTRTWEFIKK
jgi:hypothetical protein